MKFRNLKYFLSESFRSMYRNRLMTFASIITVSACTIVLAVSYFLLVNLEQVVESVERSFSIEVFIYNDIEENHIETLGNRILTIEHVNSIVYISFEEAFELAGELFEDSLFIAGVSVDTFPRSFSVEVLDLEMHEYVANVISLFPEVEGVRHDVEGVEIVLGVANGIQIIGVVVVLFLGLISTIIIINTIKITVSSRKNEISIMKYVGATNSFIRWPFLMEGILIGFLGSLLALIISYFIYTASIDALITRFYQMTAIFEFRNVFDVFIVLSPLAIALGVLIGVIGSASSVRKYLKV